MSVTADVREAPVGRVVSLSADLFNGPDPVPGIEVELPLEQVKASTIGADVALVPPADLAALCDEVDALRAAGEGAARQIARLADFIVDEVDGEPSASEGAADTAIRIIVDLLAERYAARAEVARLGAVADAIEAELAYKYTAHQQQIHFPQTTHCLKALSAPPRHILTGRGTTFCLIEHAQVEVEEGRECSACGAPVEARAALADGGSGGMSGRCCDIKFCMEAGTVHIPGHPDCLDLCDRHARQERADEDESTRQQRESGCEHTDGGAS